MILPPELLKGFLYFTYDDHINYLSSKTKVIVARKQLSQFWFFKKGETIVKDVYEFNMITRVSGKNHEITTYYKSEPCLELIEQLTKIQNDINLQG